MPRRVTTGRSSEMVARAREAAERIRASGRVEAEPMTLIVEAVLQETARNRFPAAALLAELAVEHEEARAVVAELAADPRPHVRRRAIRCLRPDTPQEFAWRLLRASLADADPNVRALALSLAGYLRFPDPIPPTDGLSFAPAPSCDDPVDD